MLICDAFAVALRWAQPGGLEIILGHHIMENVGIHSGAENPKINFAQSFCTNS